MRWHSGLAHEDDVPDAGHDSHRNPYGIVLFFQNICNRAFWTVEYEEPGAEIPDHSSCGDGTNILSKQDKECHIDSEVDYQIECDFLDDTLDAHILEYDVGRYETYNDTSKYPVLYLCGVLRDVIDIHEDPRHDDDDIGCLESHPGS